jgi:hypothetical protein
MITSGDTPFQPLEASLCLHLFLQASVYSAEPGVTLDDPDATALDVLGGMLSSFGGTLFDQVCRGQPF